MCCFDNKLSLQTLGSSGYRASRNDAASNTERHDYTGGMTEEEQLEEAIRASLDDDSRSYTPIVASIF